VHDAGLGRFGLQPQLGQPFLQHAQGTLGLPPGMTDRHQIVGLCRGPDYADDSGEFAGQGRFGRWMLGIILKRCCGSEGVEMCQEGVRCLVAAGSGVGRGDSREGPLLDRHVGVDVGLGRFRRGVAHPRPGGGASRPESTAASGSSRRRTASPRREPAGRDLPPARQEMVRPRAVTADGAAPPPDASGRGRPSSPGRDGLRPGARPGLVGRADRRAEPFAKVFPAGR